MNILFIGNSHTYRHELQDMFAQLYRAGGHGDIYSVRCADSGVSLSRHWANDETHEMIDERKWDYVVLQERSGGPLEALDEFTEYATRLHNEIVMKCDASVVLYMTWANLQRPEDQATVTRAYCELQEDFDCMLAPVGVAWEKALNEIPNLRLHDDDNRHAAPTGTYLAALVFYATITGADPADLPSRIESDSALLAEAPTDLASQLQRIAYEVVNG